MNLASAAPIHGHVKLDRMSTALHVTAAAIVRVDERYLLVEEEVDGRRVINQPAGHWEPDESLPEAVVRETLEETGWQFRPHGLVGIYQWQHPNGRDTFLRFAFYGDVLQVDADRALDPEIKQVLWWTKTQLRSASVPLRSPQVLRCIEDFESGARFSLNCLNHIRAADD